LQSKPLQTKPQIPARKPVLALPFDLMILAKFMRVLTIRAVPGLDSGQQRPARFGMRLRHYLLAPGKQSISAQPSAQAEPRAVTTALAELCPLTDINPMQLRVKRKHT